MRSTFLLSLGCALLGGCWLSKSPGGDAPGDDTAGDTDTDADGDADAIPFEDGAELAWAVRAGGPGADRGAGLLALPGGDLVVGGSFTSPAVFGEGQAGETELDVGEDTDIFLARYDADGQLVWVTWAGAASDASIWFLEYAIPFGIAPDGSLLVFGACSTGAMFGQGEPNETQIASEQPSSVFLARYTQDGELAEVVDTGARVEYVAADEPDETFATYPQVVPLVDGGALLSGAYSGTALLGPGQAEPIVLESLGGYDFFCALVDADLEIAWARSFGGAGDDFGGCRPLDDGGAIAVGGTFDQPLTLAQGEPDEIQLEPEGARDGFAARFDADWDLAWAIRFGGPDAAEAWYWGASPLWGEPPPVDGVGLVGIYKSQIGFGSTASADPVMLDPSGLGAFVARYGGDGELGLAERIVCQQSCSPHRPWAVDATGAFLMSGTFDVKVTLEPDGPTETELVSSSSGNADYFLALYRGDGQLVWARREGGPYFDYAAPWPIDDESFAVVGHFGAPGPFGGTTTVGTGDPNQVELQSAGDFDVLLAKYAAK